MIFLSFPRMCFAASFLLACALSQAQSDSVTGGRYRGSSKVRVGQGAGRPDTNIVPTAGFANLLTGVRMESTGGIFTRTTVGFGPFTNHADVPLTITLTHIGGSSHRHATGYINDVEVVRENGGTAVFTVPPKATYRWHVKNEHAITASVPSATVSIRDVGLPAANDFALPKRSGIYRGCINVYEGYDTEGYGDPYRIVAVEYYFAESPMSDGSDGWGPPLVKPEFGVVVAGPPPTTAPGPCVNPRERPIPTDDGGGS